MKIRGDFCLTCRFWLAKDSCTGEVIGEFWDYKRGCPAVSWSELKGMPFWGECRRHAGIRLHSFRETAGEIGNAHYPHTHRRHWCGDFEGQIPFNYRQKVLLGKEHGMGEGIEGEK